MNQVDLSWTNCICFSFTGLKKDRRQRQKQSFATHLKVCCAQTDVAFFTFTLHNTLVAVLRAKYGETADSPASCVRVCEQLRNVGR